MLRLLNSELHSDFEIDENRALVVAAECFPKLVNLVNDDSVLMFAVTVLLNLCLDYGECAKLMTPHQHADGVQSLPKLRHSGLGSTRSS